MAYLPTGGARTCEDGYNWRKYGQRSVKTSQYPRSYYKCSHPNCNVKRRLQRSPDGQITEIIYDGVHNHPRHQYNQEEILRTSFLHNQMLEASDASRAEGEAGSEWGVGGLETSTSVLTANSDPWSKPEVNLSCAIFESDGTSELSPGDAAADDDDDESESKRRKIEISALEPRVVVLTDSGVDVLDDGYCWRKYGKKFIKGNVNPRSYFRCISRGCSVRKQVERVSHNWKSVSTTYDGKHNHEVPAVKKLYWLGDGTIFPTATSTHPTFAFARNVNGLKADEAQSQVHSPFFQRMHHDLDNGTVLSTLLGDCQFGVGAISPTVSTTQPTLAFSRNVNGLKAEAQYQVHSPFLQRTHQDLDNETVLSTLHGDCRGETLSPTASTTQPTLAFGRNANSPKAEAESQDHSSFFQGIHLDFDDETLLSTLLEDSNTGRKIESPTSVYQMKLENPLLRRTFVPNFPMPSSPLSISTSGSTEPSSSNVSNHDRENGYSHYCFGGMSTNKVNQAL